MTSIVEFILNGERHQISQAGTNTTLLDYLRAQGLTGTKEGCAEGDCGACTVVLVEQDQLQRPVYRAVNSCLLLLPSLAGRQLVTVEALAQEKLHPVQRAMAQNYGSQCGYCTPGFVLSLFEAYYREDLDTTYQLFDQLAGNLCRCTGYRPIKEAAQAALAERRQLRQAGRGDRFDELLATANLNLPHVDYHGPDGHYWQPTSLDELLRLRAEHPDAELVAGATELAVAITKQGKRFPKLISTSGVAALRSVKEEADGWHVGGGATLTDIQDALGDNCPALAQMLRVFASRQIRNRATLAGNLVTASPIGDLAPVMLSLGARCRLLSVEGERTVAIDDFFTGYRRTVLQPTEIVAEVVLPKVDLPQGWQRLSASYKVSKRRDLDISIVAAAFQVDLDPDGMVRDARIAYGGVAPTPVLVGAAAQALVGQRWSPALVGPVNEILQRELSPISDVRGSAGFRRALVGDLFAKFVAGEPSVAERARGEAQSLESMTDSAEGGASQVETEDDGRSLPHDSAQGHVCGCARFAHDEGLHRGALELWPVCSTEAHARVRRIDSTAARAMPGVVAVLTAHDVPGELNVGPIAKDEELLPRDTVHYHGQIIALVVAQDRDSARRAARTVVVEYDPLPAIVTIDEALAQGATFDPPQAIRRGDCQGALDDSSHRLSGELRIPGQEHFYLETQAAWAARGDDDDMEVLSSTQHPSEAQETVAEVLGLPANRVVVRSQRMGGAFGGKESQAHLYAAMAALAAWHTRRSACLQLDRDIDMQVTGKRHPALARYDAAFEPDGKVTALRVRFFLDAGFSLDLSPAILARTLFHADNAYFIPNLEVEGHLLRTNKASNTAFRGFGGPQGMLVIEEVMDRVARQLGLLPEEVRQRNLYHGTGETNRTHYGMDIGDNRLEQIWTSLRRDSELGPRRQAIAAFNAAQDSLKRGIAMTPVKFGISFTAAPLNQAGALVNVYRDGTAQVSIAGTEMGQGLNSKVRGVAMRELGLSARAVRVMCTSTEKVPNTSPTAGSTGADLNGAAVKVACETLRGRLASVFADLVADQLGRTLSAEEVLFSQDQVSCAAQPELKLPLAEVTTAAHQQRVSLSAVGYYRTPGIHYDPQLGRGKPFHYFACGAAVAEVEVDCRTGMWRLLAADILHDVGDSLNPQIDRGQIEGAFLQGTGWLTGEELLWDGEGRLLTHSASLYQIPGLNDGPGRFTVALLAGSSQANTVHGSKAVGEPPFMLAFSVREAIREAVAAFGDQPAPVELPIPATVEAIHWAIGQQSSAKR